MSKALQDCTLIMRYARYLPHKRRRETWEEMITRVMDMHRTHYADRITELKGTPEGEELDDAMKFVTDMMLQKRVLGSQRALQFGGKPILKCQERMYNCSATYMDRTRAFQEASYLLLCGSGVGFSVQYHHVNKLPNVVPLGPHTKENTVTYLVDDSIEGWSDAIGVLVSSYFADNQPFPEYAGKHIDFDFSSIRPRGAEISSGNGKAPGPEPLRKSLKLISDVFEKATEHGQARLKPIQVYDMMMFIADSVIAGGVRRSATIAVFSKDDNEMMKAKTGNWFIENPQRGRSNNSVMLIRDEVSRQEFHDIIENVKSFGEPGFVLSDHRDVMFNPCVPRDTIVMTSTGPRRVSQLIDTPFTAVVDGKKYLCPTGFKMTNKSANVYLIETAEGYSVRCTANHRLMTANGEWKELKDLRVGEQLKIHNHTDHSMMSNIDKISSDYVRGSRIGKTVVNHINRSGQRCIFRVLKALNINIGTANRTPHSDLIDSLLKSILTETNEFIAGFLHNIVGSNKIDIGDIETDLFIHLVDQSIMRVVQALLLHVGIHTTISEEKLLISDVLTFYERFKGELPSWLEKILSDVKDELCDCKLYSATITSITHSEIAPVYDCTVPEVNAFDGNGFYLHNCVEISLYPKDVSGLAEADNVSSSGWEACNLSEIHAGAAKTAEEFYDACRAASIIGTLQAGYTKFPYLGAVTERIIRRESLLGVSMTGIMDNPSIVLDPEILRKGAEIVKQTNKRVAGLIGIPVAARTTCVKPAGSTSCILGTSSGIHPAHSRRYFRRVQINKDDPAGQYYASINPQAVEESVWSTGKTDNVITFLCETGDESFTKKDMSAIELLEKVKLVQQNWVAEGKNPIQCVKPWLQHNVSNTINVASNDWHDVADYIYDNREFFTGIALLGEYGDKTYQQAPFQAVYTPEELVNLYGSGVMFVSGLIVHAEQAFDGDLFSACRAIISNDVGSDPSDDDSKEPCIKAVQNHMNKKIFLARVKKFAGRYFDGDMERLTHCLKDVDSWKHWTDLERTHTEVDWTEFKEKKDNTKLGSTIACSGGQCELVRL